MSHRLSLSLPDRLYDDIGSAARRAGVSRAEWVRRKLDRALGTAGSLGAHLTPREQARLLARRGRAALPR
jgi:hypothetical protein